MVYIHFLIAIFAAAVTGVVFDSNVSGAISMARVFKRLTSLFTNTEKGKNENCIWNILIIL